MHRLEFLLRIGGALHFSVLIASASVPAVLDWRRELKTLSLLTRQLVWVHGIFIVLVIIGFGTIALLNAKDLADGSPLSDSVCGFIALFWTARLTLQFLFDPKPHLRRKWLILAHHGLTLVFAYFSAVFGYAALHGIGG